MSRIAYVNGRYVRHADASIHVEDRGFQFADAIYEVWALMDGRLADSEGHFTRLERSLSELEILMHHRRRRWWSPSSRWTPWRWIARRRRGRP